MFGSPISHRIQDRLQGLTILGQRVINSRRNLGKDLAANNSVPFKFAQLLRQHLLGDVRNITLKFAEPANSQAVNIIKNYRFPLPADDIHGDSHRTILLVEYFHGYKKVPTTILDSEPLYYTEAQQNRQPEADASAPYVKLGAMSRVLDIPTVAQERSNQGRETQCKLKST